MCEHWRRALRNPSRPARRSQQMRASRGESSARHGGGGSSLGHAAAHGCGLRAAAASWLGQTDPLSAANYSAAAVIADIEAARSRLSVPFYMYDRAPNVSVEAELASLDACARGTGGVAPKVSAKWGEYYFIRTLATHRWRVRDPALARVIVPPVFLGTEARNLCPGYDAAHIFEAIRYTEEWRTRRADHLFVGWSSSDLKYGHRHWRGVASADKSSLPLKGRAATWTFFEVDSASLSAFNGAQLVNPYVDHEAHREVAGTWAGRLATRRDIRFFFGGSTDTQREGMHVRWALMRKRATLPTSALLIDTTPANETAVEPTLARCDESLLAVGETVPRGACKGSYDAGKVLTRTSIVLAPRGDSPTTRRLTDAMEYGAIPLFVSDPIFRMGTPFRCLVPYHLFSLSVPEEEFERSPAETLRAIDAALSGPRRATMLQLIGHFRRDLLWRLPGSRVAENLLLEAVHGQRAAKDGRQRKCCLLEPVLTRGGWRRGGASQERGGRSST